MTSTTIPPTPQTARDLESVIIRPWPKVVFLYPTFLCATVFFLLSALWEPESRMLGNTFMLVLSLNLLVFAFDFSRIKSITIVALVISVVLLVLWADTKWDVTGYLGRVVGKIDIRMNTGFYGFLSGFLGFILVLVFVNSRFNYYEVNAREILHHSGYLGDVKRWSTEGLEMNKEICDLVEFMLLRSGRLIFLPQGSREAIVLDNVVKVNQAEDRIKDLLSFMAVRMNQVPGPG
ncbi:MAG TPA: hypothetical protein VK348_13980 [Planctomycetota bacterium]|nr:hypothetical protein [Planctomycetota bacterium]